MSTTSPTHARFTVRVAAHERDPGKETWRIRHAAETIALTAAYFTGDSEGRPARAADGTFEIHAPSRTTLGTLRSMITDHEGLIIVAVDEVPGLGLLRIET